MAMQKIKKGDTVRVIAGKDKGRDGTVLRVVKAKNKTRVVVEGVNLVKKHTKPNPQKNVQGGIVEREAAMDISNVAVLNPISKKADRVGVKTLDDGRKVRYFKSNDELVDV